MLPSVPCKKACIGFCPCGPPGKSGGNIKFSGWPSAAAVTARLPAPSLGLKKVQRGILSLLSVGEVSPHATAYQPGCTLLRNAAPHVGQPFVVKLDIANFFGSIPFPAVYAAIDRALCRNPEIQSSAKASSAREGATESYNAALSFFFATLCTLDGVLPQGAPTSPLLSNLVFFPLDCRIAAFCEGRKIHYTRYSDDLTFSGDFSPDTLIRFIRRLLCEHGFLLHESKTVIARRGNRQQVTGILVNDRPQAGRKFRRRIRQELYYIQRFGLSSHLLHEGRTASHAPQGPIFTVCSAASNLCCKCAHMTGNFWDTGHTFCNK